MLVLSAQEIVYLTGKVKPTAQARQLEHLGIPYKPRTDGSLVVLRIHVEATQDATPPRREPRVRAG